MNRDYDEWMYNRGDDGVTPLQDAILELLEKAGIPANINDKIIELIEQGERIVA